VAERIGLLELLMILFVVGSTAIVVGFIVFIIKHLLKKRAIMEDEVGCLEDKIDD